MISVRSPLVNAAHAPVVLAAAVCGAIAAGTHARGAGSEPLVAAISPEQVQQWTAVIVDTANKLFALFNVAVGVWQSFELARRHRARRKASRESGGRETGHGATPRTGGASARATD